MVEGLHILKDLWATGTSTRSGARRERYGFSYWVVHTAEIDAFAPVVAALAGR